MADTENPLVAEHRIMSARLVMSQSWVKFFMEAYDALLYHGVNYRTTKAYKDEKGLLNRAADARYSFEEGYKALLRYHESLIADIKALIRRKGMKEV